MPRFHLVVAVLLALMLGVALACNGDDDDRNGTPGDGTTVTTTPFSSRQATRRSAPSPITDVIISMV